MCGPRWSEVYMYLGDDAMGQNINAMRLKLCVGSLEALHLHRGVVATDYSTVLGAELRQLLLHLLIRKSLILASNR